MDFLITPTAAGSHVKWTFDAEMGNNPIARFFGCMMDDMLGPDYERGLAKLKTVAEEQAKQASAAPAERETASE